MTDTSAREAARRALQESLDRRDNGGPAALLGAAAPAHADSAPADPAPAPTMRTPDRGTRSQAAVPQPSSPSGATTGGPDTERRRYGAGVAAVA